jgi:hypothetical protein
MLGEIDTSKEFFWRPYTPLEIPIRRKVGRRIPDLQKALLLQHSVLSAPRHAHCALLRGALTFKIIRLYEVRDGEPLSVTARMMWATPDEHGLFAGAQFGRHAAVTVATARALSPCEIVTAAMFCPGTKPASA